MKKPSINQILSARLRTSRTRLGLTQQGLAELTGFSLSAIGNWESCQNVPSPNKLGLLSRKLGVSIDYLLGNAPEPEPQVAPGYDRDRRVTPADARSLAGAKALTAAGIRRVPIVAWAHAGTLKAYTDLDESWHEYTATTCRDENSFAVIIEGDSMEPKYSSGDIAITMPNVEPRNGCLVVCKLKNEGVFFKLFHQTSDGKNYRLSSYNTVYPVMECRRDDFVWIYPVYQVTKNVWR